MMTRGKVRDGDGGGYGEMMMLTEVVMRTTCMLTVRLWRLCFAGNSDLRVACGYCDGF